MYIATAPVRKQGTHASACRRALSWDSGVAFVSPLEGTIKGLQDRAEERRGTRDQHGQLSYSFPRKLLVACSPARGHRPVADHAALSASASLAVAALSS